MGSDPLWDEEGLAQDKYKSEANGHGVGGPLHNLPGPTQGILCLYWDHLSIVSHTGGY